MLYPTESSRNPAIFLFSLKIKRKFGGILLIVESETFETYISLTNMICDLRFLVLKFDISEKKRYKNYRFSDRPHNVVSTRISYATVLVEKDNFITSVT